MTKKYGIKVTLPDTDPMRAPHLLGPEWAYWRWFRTAEERDAAFDDMQSPLKYYRTGDQPSQILTKVEQDEED
jgi:hypothetical protein